MSADLRGGSYKDKVRGTGHEHRFSRLPKQPFLGQSLNKMKADPVNVVLFNWCFKRFHSASGQGTFLSGLKTPRHHHLLKVL